MPDLIPAHEPILKEKNNIPACAVNNYSNLLKTVAISISSAQGVLRMKNTEAIPHIRRTMGQVSVILPATPNGTGT